MLPGNATTQMGIPPTIAAGLPDRARRQHRSRSRFSSASGVRLRHKPIFAPLDWAVHRPNIMSGCHPAGILRMKVPVMSTRLAIAIVAVFATGLILTPVEASARNGGFAGSHAIGFHGGFPARAVRPAFRPALGRTHGVTHFRHRRFSGAGASWGAWGYAPYDLGYGYYEPPAVVSEGQPSEEPSPAPPPPRRGCSTQIYKVPSESGGEVPVKVVRC
jgi:hypothetical protein